MLAPTHNGHRIHFHARCYTEFQEEHNGYRDPYDGRDSEATRQAEAGAEDTQLGF